jgi:low temperature requirement protein LtrA
VPHSSQPADLLVLFTALLALVFSPSLSAIIAPYAVILAGALLGTGWGLRRRPAASRGAVWGFVVLMLGTALVFTMPAAVWLQSYFGPGSYQWLLAPLAAVIAAIGDDWPRVGTWAASMGRRVIGRRMGDTQ